MRTLLLLATVCCARISANPPDLQPIRIYDEARSLSRRSVEEVVRLASRDGMGVWLLVGDTSQTLPEKRFIDAYLQPQTSSARLRRGRVVSLESRIVKGSAVRWSVGSSNRMYAQVSRQPNRWPASLNDRSIERPFLVDGGLSDQELIEIVSFVRSSPHSPKEVDADGTMHVDFFDLDGTVPIGEISRERSEVVVVLPRSTRHGETATLRKRGASWRLVSVTMWLV